ncbi:hypothetical protein [Mycoavidus sp. B2-EB]|uniref:hypothetical protein n=1 Tax=Mycoavidus sp. B2-EB TaxID=2651972 RepID=UPI001623D665|nr:hypothetical protein [Mycoavidus sp. B2-EB]BBO59687.1 hemagglutinin [Mycoavidus sp. B2-EB]
MRAALHGVLAYGGAVARGQSGGSAALGASASVWVNHLLGPVEGSSEEEKEARKNIVTSLVAGVARVGGADAASAQNAAQIETENNAAVVLAAPLAFTPPGVVVLSVVAAGLVAWNANEAYQKYRANNAGQDGEDGDEDQLILRPPRPMITPMEPPQSRQIPGREWRQDKEVLLEGMPDQSGEHLVQPFVTPNQFGEYTVAPLILPITEALGKLGNAIFSKETKANRDKDYVPNAGSVQKMENFFNETEFGREMKDIANPTKEIYKGSRVYEATERIKGKIEEGDLFYLDRKHKNHLEVYTENRVSRHVLNLDGTVNRKKTDKARGRRLEG